MSLLKSILKSFGEKYSKNNLEQSVKVNDSIKKSDGVDVSSLVVFAPKNVEEVNRVIDCVSNGQPIIINFSSIKKAEYNSISNYLSGALFALKASISRLQNEIYVIMPKSKKLATL